MIPSDVLPDLPLILANRLPDQVLFEPGRGDVFYPRPYDQLHPFSWSDPFPMVQPLLGFLVESRISKAGSESWLPLPLTRSVAGLGDAVAMRPAPDDEEEVPTSPKERKRKRESPANLPKPKKNVARRSKEEEEDDDCLLVARQRNNAGASKSVEPVKVGVAHSGVEEISEGSSKGTSPRRPFVGSDIVIHDIDPIQDHREAELKRISKERDDLKTLYVKKEVEISDLRVELMQACQGRAKYVEKFYQKADLVAQLQEELKMKEAESLGWRQIMDNLASEKETLREELASLERQFQSVKEESLARGRDIEELKAKSTAELAKARSDADAIMSSYRADAEAAYARAKEISSAAEAKLSNSLDHARRQYWRVTLEEVHARGFDLSNNIERAKILEEEAAALLSDDDDFASGSESGEDEDEVPEDEALEDAAAEDVSPK
ncbi:PREDICTED: uncharacterized protein LOC109208087 [Nicotiana attenuata]|uniref:uncharacterized protein LOC109208087 n=1 Tax=Nicotiana attenuata TaxID=49451 RepID=UPI000904BD35|nr:PREDICTED: uncharacterized protein LOC109208087 [Nicotiana attenuata]